MTVEAAPAVEYRHDLPILNTTLLRDLVVWAAADQDFIDKTSDFFTRVAGWGKWEQGLWADVAKEGQCKSSYCIAGQAVAQSNFVLLTDDGPWGSAEYCAPLVRTNKVDSKGKAIYEADLEQTEAIHAKAEKDLGLSADEADMMFDGDNDLSRIVSLATYFAKRRGLVLGLPAIVAAHDDDYDDDNWDDTGAWV